MLNRCSAVRPGRMFRLGSTKVVPMVLEDALRQVIREEVRAAVREAVVVTGPGSARVEEFVSIAEAAVLARKSPSTIRNWIQQGKLRSYGEGREIALRSEDVRAVAFAPKDGGSRSSRSTAKTDAHAEALLKGRAR
jgi:excisionase family DNA binding protein